VATDPYRLDDATWLPVPTSIDERARPAAPQESAPFWDGLREGVVRFQSCGRCGRRTHYPIGGCQWCGGPVTFVNVDATATINTWTLSLLEFAPGMETPYVTAIVNPLVEPGIQLMTNIVGCRVDEIRIGMTVHPYIEHGRHASLLFFTPRRIDDGGPSSVG
jgi:uncharacterized OB-fold protein